MNQLADILLGFAALMKAYAFYYPLMMAWLWISGSVIYFFRRERGRELSPDNPPELKETPPVSILIPCYNEGDTCRESIEAAVRQRYPAFEVIAINDGSSDATGAILDELAELHPRLRVVHLEQNQGKSMALRMGAMVSPHEYLVCIDADGILDPHATTWLVHQLVSNPRVGAVSGNPRVRNRSTLLGRIQVGEFSAIVGMLKRTQRIWGRLFTVSGAVSAYRRSALQRVDYWSLDMVTEDIDMSWKLQLDKWDVRFEPNALCWLLTPETVGGLWAQRLRWAQGGAEVLMRHYNLAKYWKSRRMWPIYMEYFASVLWSYVMATIAVLWVLGRFMPIPDPLYVDSLLFSWCATLLGITCLTQFAVSLAIDSRYEKGIGRFYYWLVWYPVVYWMLSVASTLVGYPRAYMRIHRGRAGRARWKSPDRGVRP